MEPTVTKTATNYELLNGLTSTPKYIPSKYFYDERGDKIFQEIMNMPEYYLTRTEYDIIEQNKTKLASIFTRYNKHFKLIELGAGDGYKTKILLNHFTALEIDFSYDPIDISENILQQLKEDLTRSIPRLKVDIQQGDYFEVLEELKHNNGPKVVLLLGSNIGNFSPKEALNFVNQIGRSLNKGDMLLIGFDLIKDPELIEKAYNDSQGITERFNMNLIKRIGEETGIPLETSDFKFYPTYNPVTGSVRSYLISLKDHKYVVEETGEIIHFAKNEAIFTEISQKYTLDQIECLATDAGFDVYASFVDQNQFFTDSLWVKR